MSTNYYVYKKKDFEYHNSLVNFYKDLSNWCKEQIETAENDRLKKHIKELKNTLFVPEKENTIHIGKYTHGHRFIFNSSNFYSLSNLKNVLDHSDVIINEYGEEISLFDLVILIESTKNQKTFEMFTKTFDGYQMTGGNWC
jgi:hypothetical protein